MQTVITIFWQFFCLGWICFGGPAAHLGYFRRVFVERRQWLSDVHYAQVVALSQFLPGPGSSQTGFAIGYLKGGLPGAIAAFAGFTLPSVLLMLLLASLSQRLGDLPLFAQLVHGLKLLAVVVVADAVLGMWGQFCRQRLTQALALVSAIILLLWPGIFSQMALLAVCALIGRRTLVVPAETAERVSGRWHLWPLLLFLALLGGLPLLAQQIPALALLADFYQAGSLVFGGGHVVLPLLQSLVGDQLAPDTFLTGYAAAQAVPGPMFTLSTYLGYQLWPSMPLTGALLATVAVFLPGFLLVLALLERWQALAAKPSVAGAVRGLNAAVVGLLMAALYQPVFSSSVSGAVEMALVVLGLGLLRLARVPIALLVLLFALAGIALPLL